MPPSHHEQVAMKRYDLSGTALEPRIVVSSARKNRQLFGIGLLQQTAASQERPQALQNRHETDQRDQDFEQVCQPAIGNEAIDQIEQDRANDDDDQNVEKQEE